MDSVIFSRFSPRGISSATSTWKSQLLPTRQSAGALVERRAASPGSLPALRPERIQRHRNGALVFDGKVDALRLRPVAQRGVEEIDALFRGHRIGSQIMP